MYGWMTNQVLINNLLQSSKEDVERLDEILVRWQSARDRQQRLTLSEAGLADRIEAFDLDPKFKERLEFLQSQPAFKNSFKGYPTKFKAVEIDKLVIPNLGVRLGFVEQLLKKLPKEPSMEDIVDFCLPLTTSQAETTRLRLDEFNYIYSSDSLDFRLIDVISRPVEELNLSDVLEGAPTRAIVILMGYGFPMVKVVSVGNRLVLDNGFHRLYALRSLGVTHVPAVVTTDASNIARTFTPDYINGTPRPPLFKDFFDPEMCIEVNVQRRRRSIKISILPQSFDVPM